VTHYKNLLLRTSIVPLLFLLNGCSPHCVPTGISVNGEKMMACGLPDGWIEGDFQLLGDDWVRASECFAAYEKDTRQSAILQLSPAKERGLLKFFDQQGSLLYEIKFEDAQYNEDWQAWIAHYESANSSNDLFNADVILRSKNYFTFEDIDYACRSLEVPLVKI